MRRVWRSHWIRLREQSSTRHRIFSPQGAQGTPRKMFSLKDKVAVVTGASQGIGRDTAKALAEAGAKVVVAARNEEKLAALVGEIVSAGGEALAVKMDVADAEQVKAGFKQVVEKFGRLDILVNNAAVTR